MWELGEGKGYMGRLGIVRISSFGARHNCKLPSCQDPFVASVRNPIQAHRECVGSCDKNALAPMALVGRSALCSSPLLLVSFHFPLSFSVFSFSSYAQTSSHLVSIHLYSTLSRAMQNGSHAPGCFHGFCVAYPPPPQPFATSRGP